MAVHKQTALMLACLTYASCVWRLQASAELVRRGADVELQALALFLLKSPSSAFLRPAAFNPSSALSRPVCASRLKILSRIVHPTPRPATPEAALPNEKSCARMAEKEKMRVEHSRIRAEEPVMSGQLASKEFSRRNLFRVFLLTAGIYYSGKTNVGAWAFPVEQAKPNYKDIYAEAQPGKGPLRILEIGAGTEFQSVFKERFRAGSEVVAVDLLRPDAKTLHNAQTFALKHGYRLRFEQGDATNLKRFKEASFDAVVCSLFLCQDFDPEVVVSEIRRVLKQGGRFGFVEHVEDIDRVIVDKVFGDSSVIRFQRWPEKTNLVAGIVMKI